MRFDDILSVIGEFGPYQKRIYFLLCLPALLCGAQLLSTVFIMAIPPHRCSLPHYIGDTYTVQSEAHRYLINLTIPRQESKPSLYVECKVYDDDNMKLMTSLYYNQSSIGYNSTSTRRKLGNCNSWTYDRSEFVNTAITEFDVVCKKKILRSHSNSAQFAGALCGSILMGVFADLFGRKKAILLSIMIHTLTTITISLSPSFELVIAMRGVLGLAAHSLFAISATTGIELVGPSKRTFTGMIVEFFWSAGCILVLPIAYFIQRWRYTQLSLCILGIPLYSLWWLIPESPRWLLGKGRYKETEKILLKICASNKTSLPEGCIDVDTSDKQTPVKVWELFTHRILIVRAFIIFINWLAVNLVFYGLTLNVENLAGSQYLNVSLITIIEVVAYLVCFFLLDRTGRIRLHCSSMILGGLACLAMLLPILFGRPEHQWIITTLALISKFFASSAFAILYIMSSELFPTVLRNSAIGFCSIFENLGGMTSAYVADLSILVGGQFAPALPMLIFGCVSLLAGFLSLLLPETLNRILPDTIQDAIEFDKKPRDIKKHQDISEEKCQEMKNLLSTTKV